MDADVVRDVLQHVHNDQEKACHQLLVIQVNFEHDDSHCTATLRSSIDLRMVTQLLLALTCIRGLWVLSAQLGYQCS